MVAKVRTFIEESRAEFRRVNWPTFAETRRLTLVVIGLSLGIALLLGLLDMLFRFLLDVLVV